MKKTIKLISVVLAGLALASCAKEELATLHPDQIKAGQLANISSEYVLNVDDADATMATFTFDKTEYGVQSAVQYALYADINSDFSKEKKIGSASSNKDGIAVNVKTINNILIGFGCSADQAVTVYFRLKSNMMGEKNIIEGTEIISNVISASITPYVAVKEYAKVWALGSFNGWKHDVAQYLYNYAEDDVTYIGVLDFGESHADNMFKITGAASWDNETGNWGVADAATPAESDEIQLLNGSNDNITQYTAKRYYLFSLNKTSLALSKLASFDQVGVVGTINEWGGTPDYAMAYNASKGRFWVDITIPAGAEIKFRADSDWGTNWGSDNGETLGKGAANIVVADAGDYRVYLNLAQGTFSLDASMFGKDEPTDETGGGGQSDEPKAWSLIGSFNGTGWGTDIDLAVADGKWIVRSVSFAAGDEFKIRADHSWDTSLGGPEENSTSTIDAGNQYGVYKPTLGTAFAAGDKNIQIPADGVYDVILTYSSEGSTILVQEHVASYALIGEIDGDAWSKDVLMSKNGEIWTSPVVNITGGFKIRYDYSWDEANVYGAAEGATVTVGTAFTAVQPGSNIAVPEAGNYKVTFNENTKEITVFAVNFPETMYMIGEEFGNWDWNSDGIVEMTPVFGQEGQFWAVRYISAGKGFKYCSKKAWNGDFWGLGTNDGFTESGGNCTVAEDGFYMIHIDTKNDFVHVEPARVFGIGNCWGAWDAKMSSALFTAEGKTLKATLPNSGEIRIYVESEKANSDWWTREFIFFGGKIAYRGNGGDQERVNGNAGQVITLDFNAGTAVLQ